MRKPVPLKVMCVKSFDCSINFPLTPLRLQILTERLISLFRIFGVTEVVFMFSFEILWGKLART